jgi:hypothetical protein
MSQLLQKAQQLLAVVLQKLDEVRQSMEAPGGSEYPGQVGIHFVLGFFFLTLPQC